MEKIHESKRIPRAHLCNVSAVSKQLFCSDWLNRKDSYQCLAWVVRTITDQLELVANGDQVSALQCYYGADNADHNLFRRQSSYLQPTNILPIVVKVEMYLTRSQTSRLTNRAYMLLKTHQVNELIRQDIADSGSTLKPVLIHERAICTWFSNHRKRDPVRNLLHALP